MAINLGTLNSHAINNAAPIRIFGSGQLIAVEQIVNLQGAGELISIEQSMNLRLSSSVAESLMSFEQTSQSKYTGLLIDFEQNVKNAAVTSLVDRAGWELHVTIDGLKIPQNQIHGMGNTTRTENTAALADVTFLMQTGTFDYNSYVGKTITIDLETASGIRRIYTGVVDIPEVDIVNEKFTLRCTDKRTEQINEQFTTKKNTIGVYSSRIFSEPKDVAEEVEQRLTTTATALDFDAYGNATLTPWAAKSTADFTLADADVYRNRPQVQFASRGRITNKVNIGMQYRYQRFYHIERAFFWTSPIDDSICNLLQFGYSLTPKSMVLSAIEAAGWPVKGDVTFTPLPSAGWYRCGGATLGFATSQIQGTNTPVTDVNGQPVKDSQGNTVYSTDIGSVTDYRGIYCVGANWTASTQWSQYITEDYTLSVQAPQSQTQYGTIENDLNYAVDDEIKEEVWEDYRYFKTTQPGTSNYYDDQDYSRAEFGSGVDVAIQQAQTQILAAHRDTRVLVTVFPRGDIDLSHTVLIDTDELVAKGKVYSVKHSFNVLTTEATTTITLVLSKAQGSQSTSAFTVPAKPTDNVTFNTGGMLLGNHFGEDPTTAAAANWNGMVGNRWISVTGNTYRTTFQEQFIVDVPAVSNANRDAKTLTGSATYNISIPDDTLTIIADGKRG